MTYTPAPVANADEKLGNKIGSTPEVTVLGNDSIAAGVGVDATSVVLLDPETDAPVKELFVDGQGTWTVTAAGTVTFAPLPALIGNPTDVRYTVADAQGNVSAPATIKVTYTPAPVANADEKLGNRIGSTAAVNLLQNDSAAEGHSLNAKSVMLIHPETSAPVKSIMIDGHGTWNVTDAGEVTFTPLDSFTGNPAPVKYTVEDMQGNITASASITVTYTEAPTTVADMIMDNETGAIVSINVLENDSAAAGHSLDAATLFLIDPSTGDHVRMLDVPGQGVWTVSSEGVITFEPDADFTGSPTPVTYQVNDTQGNASQPAMITIGYVDPTDIPLIEDILEEDLKQTAVLLSGNASRISLRAADRLDPNRGQQCGRNINDLLKENPVQFTSNSFFIDARNNDVLNEIARLLGTCPGVGFMIAGHTDSDASETYNITLSQNRVDAVRTALADRGVTVDRLQTRGFGESQPVATNATEEGQAMNRRVEFVLLEDAAAAQAACGDSGIVRRNVTGSGNDDGTSLTGDFASSGYDCVTDTYSETWGDLSVKHDDDLGTTGMLTLGTLRERQNDNKLFGRFIEGYLSRSDVDADGASGTITGVGVHAGLYGARATDSGLILSYYGSAAVGRHDFKIDAGAPTDGSYTYAGVFVGAAVGGERQLGEMMVRPSVGIDLGYARTIGSEISVADVDLEVDPVTFARGFVSLGMTHEMDAGSLDFTPRLFCAVGGDSDDNACGFGGSLNYVTLADTEGARWDVSFDYERIADSQTASLRLARTWDIFDGLGVSKSSFGATQSGGLEVGQTIDFEW